ncbi:response regulator [Conexibacter sp. W3-3-2]|uniref:Sensory transduction protein RegX3 n=1 Tax=Paraconexibacter algicola TaxID=2133960 RepID=A0A2T4UMX8_9ACTN|nr:MULTISPECIES: response regulator transcription factor [Solirubrobacterales]MTD44090.1 response regulator [Conexibacter sp. W3-3-2]PTL60579.1 DNA-binding response regulator [Paraconexibacter algicola]
MPGAQSLLVVEDEDSILQPLLRALARAGFEPTSARSVREATALIDRRSFDLVLLDLGLPDGDGRDVCRHLRRTSETPVIMLTARGAEIDRIVGLELGADDYVVKPFSSDELVARIRAVLRRSAGDAGTRRPQEAVTVAALQVDPAARTARVDDVELDLTRREFDLLFALARRAGSVAGREELFDEVWGTGWFGTGKTLDVHVAGLRRKLPPGAPPITTLRGVGYRMDVP